MHEYTKRVPIRTTLVSLKGGYVFTDVDTILKSLQDDSVKNKFIINNSRYEMFIYINKLSEYSKVFILNVDIYDEDYKDVEPRDAIKLFESETDFRNFIKTSVAKYIESLNNLQLKFHYFSRFDGAYDVHNNRMYAAVYDFSTNKFLPAPEVKETILKFEDCDVDKLIEYIMKT